MQTRSTRRRPSREQTERFEYLRSTRDKVAAELGLDSSIVAPRGALEAAAVDPDTPLLMRWQRSCSTSTRPPTPRMPLESDIVALALPEDIGSGDVTTRYFTDPTRRAEARVVAREPCIVAGLGVAEEVFHRVDPALAVVKVVGDGARLAAGGIAMKVRGRAASLLTAERTALNFLQRLSGVATLTGEFVAAIRGTSARILDTRKTTPGMRVLEKAAVLAGGGRTTALACTTW